MLGHARIFRTAAAIALAIPVASCGSADDSTVNIAYVGTPRSPFDTGVFLSSPAQQVRAATAEGLVAFDAQGRVVPALADRWIITDDGLSYIFRLRDGTWRDGSELSADSARSALRERLRGLRGSSLGLDLSGIDEIRAMAGRVVEIRLSRPMPHLLQLLAQPEMGLVRKGRGAGPMTMRREGDTAILTPIAPERLGMPAITGWDERVRTLRVDASSGEKAVARFNAGEADVMLGGTIAEFPLARSVGLLRGTIQIDPVNGLLGLSVLNDRGFLSSPANREAIAMAIDRAALIEPFGISGWKTSTRIVSSAVEDDLGTIGERWEGITIAARKAQAASRVATWRQKDKAAEAPRLLIALPPGPGSDDLLAGLVRDLGEIGLDLRRAGKGQRADLELVDDVARYPRATWYLNRLNCSVRRSLCSTIADKRVAEAMKAANEAERLAQLAEAEAELTKANVYIPIGAPIRWSLVRGDAIGFAANAWGWHPLMPMALRPK